MFYIPQLNSCDCGLACLKMVLANLNHDENYLFLKSDEAHKEYSFLELSNIAKTHGCEMVPFKVEEKREILKNEKFPLIVALKMPSGAYHSVVVTKVTFGTLKIFDPDLGIYSLHFKKFEKLWTGKGLIVDSFNKTDCKEKYENPIKMKDHVGNLILQIISSSLLVAAFYFLQNQTKPLIPMLFIVGFVLFEVLYRLNNIRVMKKIDAFQGKPIEGKYYEHFKRFENYKKTALVNPAKIVLALLIVAFAIAILIMNNVMTIVVIVTPLLLAFIDVVFIQPDIEMKENALKYDESALNTCENLYDYQVKTMKIHKNSYDLAKLILLKKYLYILLMAVSAIIVMFVTETVVLPYAAFYVLIQYLLFENITNLLNYNKQNYDLLKSKALFLNSRSDSKEK